MFFKSLGFVQEVLLEAAHVNLIPKDQVQQFKSNHAVEDGRIKIYSDSSGFSIGYEIQGDCMGLFAGIYGANEHRVRGVLRGAGLAELHVLDAYGLPTHRLLACVDDPHLYPFDTTADFPVDAMVEFEKYHLGLLPFQVAIYETVARWRDMQKSLKVLGQFVAPRFAASTEIAKIYTGEELNEGLARGSMFQGIIKKVEERINHATGEPWLYCIVDCGFEVAVALPIDEKIGLYPGGVIEGVGAFTGSSGHWLKPSQ